MLGWLKESNRMKHFWYAIPLGLFLTILCAIGCAGGMEYKDKAWGGKWDWLDFAATCLGGLVGQVLQIILYFVIF